MWWLSNIQSEQSDLKMMSENKDVEKESKTKQSVVNQFLATFVGKYLHRR